MADNTITKKDAILEDINNKLKEEKWTRAAIDSYSVRNFVEMDSYIRLAIDEDFKDDLKTLCKEHLKQSQNSVVALYMIGVLSLEESSVDDTHLPQIIKIFMDSKKNKIAEFLSEKILSYRENKFALKTLESIYEQEKMEDELFNIKKRLVLIDSKDASNANYLGKYYEEEGDKDLSMFYYRLAIERYIRNRSVKMVEELWNRMIQLAPEDDKMIIIIAKKIKEVLGDEKVGGMVFDDVVKPAMKDEKYGFALRILKVIIDFKPHDKQIRKAIEDCYRKIYETHSQLEKYLKSSQIGQSWKPHKEAIRHFETHIAFDKGSYVSHKSWGIGVVKEISNDNVIIDFENKDGLHTMSLKIALRALTVLEEDNITIWKKFKLDELKAMMYESPLKVLEFILKSSGGEVQSKEVKVTLVPDVIENREWNKWWALAKTKMESSNTVVQSLTKHNVLELRDTEETIVEELVSKFKKATNFENKVRIFIDFINRGGELNSDNAQAVASFFKEVINAKSESPEKRLLSFTLLKSGNWVDYRDADVDTAVIFGVKNLQELYESLDMDIRQSFLDILEKKLKDWDFRYGDFILNCPINKYHNYMLKKLVNYQKYEVLNNIFVSAMNNFQEDPETFLWLAKLIMENIYPDMNENIGIRESELIFRLVTLIDILNHEIDSKTNVGKNKKIVSGIEDLLFKKELLSKFVENAEESAVKSILSLLYMNNTLAEDNKEAIIEQILKKYPELKKAPRQEKIKIRHPFLVTKAAISDKQEELKRIMNEEIPQNSQAIGEAMEKGDLRENAEYKAALEKQDQLKATASKLEAELNQAKVLKKEMVDTSIVDVGTKVTMTDQNGDKIAYTILGQWDVDTEHGILSYHSPLGKALMDKKVGDSFDFEALGETKTYTIDSIEMADFE